jgi:hypothetical protein
MADSSGRQNSPDRERGEPGRPANGPLPPLTQGAATGEDRAQFPATEPAMPQPADEAHWGRTQTARGWQPQGGHSPPPGPAGYPAASAASPAGSAQIRRFGPGVPAPAAGGDAVLSAGEIWQSAQPAGPYPRRAVRLRRRAWTAFSVLLIIASGVVIWLRLHHPPLGVTGVAITSQAKSGCAVDVTGQISTTGGAGTVSYQWVFTPQEAAPQPVSQSVASGQSSVYVTAAIEGQGHGTLAQRVTLQVLGPGHGSATAQVVLTC